MPSDSDPGVGVGTDSSVESSITTTSTTSKSDSDAATGVGTPADGGSPLDKPCPRLPQTHLSLPEYWEILGISECQAWGIRNVPDEVTTGCEDYWSENERYWLAWSIAKAEERFKKERWLGFPIRREYNDNLKPRQLTYNWPANVGRYLRGIGVETEEDVANVALTLSSGGVIREPVEFTITVDFTDEDELLIYYPGSSHCTIRPSELTISGTTATIKIPRCRLLKGNHRKNFAQVNDRPDYEDDNNFVDSVDIKRNYLNEATGANLVWYRHEGQLCCLNGVTVCQPSNVCSDVKQLACPYIQDQRDGWFSLEPAAYSSGAWSKQTYAVNRRPDSVEVNFMRFYYDRYEPIDEDIARAIIAVAHNNMPEDYCSCSVQMRYFEEDNKPLEPPVNLGLGPSTWGIFEAKQIIQEFDSIPEAKFGGLL